jgi:hypothetical protein
VAVAQRTLTGVQVSPASDWLFLKDVARTAH